MREAESPFTMGAYEWKEINLITSLQRTMISMLHFCNMKKSIYDLRDSLHGLSLCFKSNIENLRSTLSQITTRSEEIEGICLRRRLIVNSQEQEAESICLHVLLTQSK